ncbi:MAG: hypothetical protein KDD27_06105 [Saprospiraceae bacterium]|nr:hypothetical protein [Saprospiraceae bacterium]
MTLGVFNFLCNKFSGRTNRQIDALKDFSLAAPFALDPEQLSDALKLLERFNWDVQKAARHLANTQLMDFDDAMLEKGDDPFESNFPPGPSC